MYTLIRKLHPPVFNVANERSSRVSARFVDAPSKPPKDRQAVTPELSERSAQIADDVIASAGRFVLDDLVLPVSYVPVIKEDHHYLQAGELIGPHERIMFPVPVVAAFEFLGPSL